MTRFTKLIIVLFGVNGNRSHELQVIKKHISNNNDVISSMSSYWKTMGITDRITIVTWARKSIGKRQHIETVQEKENIMLHQVKYFKGLFIELFQKGLSLSWDEDGKIIYHFEYLDLLVTKLD